MAKKKQLAGKKTKLAKLPLTQVLAQQVGEAAPWGPPPAPPEPEPRQLPLTWEQAEEGAAGPLASAYLQVVQELAALLAELPRPPGKPAWTPEVPLPATIPPTLRLKQALRQARKDLGDLERFLSR
jgi:hypothetical protein